jgi:hypothetical protein
MSQDRQEIRAATTDVDDADDADGRGHTPVVVPVATEAVGSWRRLQGWSGMALIAGGVLLPLATLLHPSLETAGTIIASEARLVAAHVLFTVSWALVLFGLPGLYAAQRTGMGRLGSAGFLQAFAGTYLLAVSGYFGFLAPVLARKAPAVIDAISQYPPVVILNGLAVIGFVLGYILFGIAMTRAAPTRTSGVLVAVGAPSHLLGFGMAQLLSPAIWPVAVLGAVSLGAGLAWPGHRLWRTIAAADRPVDTKEPV